MPIVTLSSDIGEHDYLVGAIKGQLLSSSPLLNIADITHYLSPSNYPQAAYICGNAFKYYPAGTFHIIIVNLFETQPKHLLVTQHRSQYIICPDNGLLTMITNGKPANVYAILVESGSSLLNITASLAKNLQRLILQNDISVFGSPISSMVEKYPLRATTGPDWIEGQILFIDRFENVVINITKEEFEQNRRGRSFKIVFKRDEIIEQISENYASVYEGEKMAWFNSAGYLEIAMNKGNIAGLFGLQGFNEKMHQQGTVQNKWFYQTVRVFFG
ncbi:MAG: SAM-dependent chlorinase/fluorinase [Bacteroidota bacterium]|nr:SAM-dependent chlorinase/fluorinase [Bacteroidota bacterium]